MIAYTVGGFFVAPAVIRSQATKILLTETGLTAQFDKIRVNPYALTLDVDGFRAGSGNGTNWISLKHLHANLQLSSLFGPAFVIKDVQLEQPELLVTWEADGSFNFDSVLARLQSKTNAEPAEIPAAVIGHLSVSNAVVRWQDNFLEPGFASELNDIDLTLTNFHTLGTNTFVFKAVLDSDAILGASGEIGLHPLKANVSAGLDNLLLEKYTSYIPDWSPFQLRKMRATGRLNIAADLSGESIQVEISEGAATVSNFELMAVGATDPVLSIGSVAVSRMTASLAHLSATIGQIVVDHPAIAINQMTNGLTDWQT